jgi:hypothetical protein
LLIKNKVTLLAKLQQWQELTAFCECHATLDVLFNNVFVEDLDYVLPFPGA